MDTHAPSIAYPRRAVEKAGVAQRSAFEVAATDQYSAPRHGGYGVITFFDCLHDIGDPVASTRHAAETLAPDGAVVSQDRGPAPASDVIG